MKLKTKFFLYSVKEKLKMNSSLCPSCGSKNSFVVDRKYIVTTLHRCQNCQLLYRVPTISSEENQSFYQHEYTQGFTTEMPSDQDLKKYIECQFKGTHKDFSNYIDILKALNVKEGSKLFDFGCSWGYGSWQLANAGFDVESFEISIPRGTYAKEKLGIPVYSDMSQVKGNFDIFFTSHVLEHLPSVKQAIDFAFNLLKPGGLFIAFTPNGSIQLKEKNPKAWHKLWGIVHPNFLDDVYYEKVFFNQSFILSSNPYDTQKIMNWSAYSCQQQVKQDILSLEGDELMCIAIK